MREWGAEEPKRENVPAALDTMKRYANGIRQTPNGDLFLRVPHEARAEAVFALANLGSGKIEPLDETETDTTFLVRNEDNAEVIAAALRKANINFVGSQLAGGRTGKP